MKKATKTAIIIAILFAGVWAIKANGQANSPIAASTMAADSLPKIEIENRQQYEAIPGIYFKRKYEINPIMSSEHYELTRPSVRRAKRLREARFFHNPLKP